MEQAVPHNTQAEEAILGAILVNPDMYLQIAQIVNADDFFIHRNRWIYESIEELIQHGIAIDIITLSDKLEKRSQLEEVGGVAYLAHLVAEVPTSLHAPAYAKIVQEEATRRRMILAASNVARLGYDIEKDIQDSLALAQSELANIQIKAGTGPVIIKKALDEHYEYIDDVRQGRIASISSGLVDLDRILAGGYKQTTLNSIAAATGMGKTAVACTLAKNMAKAGHSPAFFSLEQPVVQIVSRLLSEDVGVPLDQFDVQGGLDNYLQDYDNAISKLEHLNLYIDDTPNQNVQALCTQIKRMYALFGIDVAIVDYLQLVQPAQTQRMRYQEIKDIMETFHATARHLKIPIILMAQLNREIFNRNDKRPVLKDLREGADIEQFSYTVTFLHREAYFDPTTLNQRLAELIVAKHRQGTTGTANVIFRGEYSRFENMTLNTYTPGASI